MYIEESKFYPHKNYCKCDVSIWSTFLECISSECVSTSLLYINYSYALVLKLKPHTFLFMFLEYYPHLSFLTLLGTTFSHSVTVWIYMLFSML